MSPPSVSRKRCAVQPNINRVAWMGTRVLEVAGLAVPPWCLAPWQSHTLGKVLALGTLTPPQQPGHFSVLASALVNVAVKRRGDGVRRCVPWASGDRFMLAMTISCLQRPFHVHDIGFIFATMVSCPRQPFHVHEDRFISTTTVFPPPPFPPPGWLERAGLPPFWDRRVEGGRPVFHNTITCSSRPVQPASVHGGILSDDMGLVRFAPFA